MIMGSWMISMEFSGKGGISTESGKLELLRQDYETEQATSRRAARLEDLREQAAGIKDSWPNLTPEERQAVIRDCVERIVVDGPKVEIYYTFLKHGAES